MCYARYAGRVDTISHRQLRNESGRILRAVAAGESFVVTNGGREVARIVPVSIAEPELRVVRPAVRRGVRELPRVRIDGGVATTLDDLRSER
jgi:prevent-host-death family protein